MPFDLAQVLRIKGMVDAIVEEAPQDPLTATPALIHAYMSAREVCGHIVAGTDAEEEFAILFPILGPVSESHLYTLDSMEASALGDSARLLLAKLAGWLGSWPSAEQLLAELVTALAAAEAEATEPEEKARLAGLREGLLGAGRQIAVNVVSHYLERVHV